MAKYGEGLGYEIVKAVHNGEIIEPITFNKVKAFCNQKGFNASENQMQVILSNSTDNTHSPTYKKYFIRVGIGKYKLALEYRKQTGYYWLNVDYDHYEWSFSNMEIGGREDYSSLDEHGGKRKKPICFKSIQIGDKVLSYETGKRKAITAICEVVDKRDEINSEIIIWFEKRRNFDSYLSLDEIKKSKFMVECEVIGSHIGTLFQLEKKYFNKLVQMLETLNNPEEEFYKKVREFRNISSEERKRILAGRIDTIPEVRQVTRSEYKRNPYVVAEVLERANGRCEKCERKAPFNRASDGTPYLEVHHKIWLVDGGEDTVENAVAVCPNCHKELHYGECF